MSGAVINADGQFRGRERHGHFIPESDLVDTHRICFIIRPAPGSSFFLKSCCLDPNSPLYSILQVRISLPVDIRGIHDANAMRTTRESIVSS